MPGNEFFADAVALVAGYLLGSIPFGYLLTRLAGAGDIRKIGSGNIGATNVLRTGRKGLALATLFLDGAKGFLPAALCMHYGGLEPALFTAAGAFLGHLFPVWLRFKGGKGVATYIGVLFGLFWPGAVFFCAVWLSVALITRYSSLAALVAASFAPFFVWWQDSLSLSLFVLALSILLILRHHENIRKLILGHERKIGGRRA
jgi:glycerol-3-phosphate acyltransferase PlsY